MNSSHEFRYLGCWKCLNGIISAHSACGYVPCWGGIRQSDSGTYWEKVRFSWLLGSGWSTAVEHTPAEQNSRGRGFYSRQVLGFFLLFLSFSP